MAAFPSDAPSLRAQGSGDEAIAGIGDATSLPDLENPGFRTEAERIDGLEGRSDADTGSGTAHGTGNVQAPLRPDDRLHLAGGAAAAILTVAIAWQFVPPQALIGKGLILLAAGSASAILFATLKEALDALGLGRVELKDFIYTIEGGALGAAAAAALACVVEAFAIAQPVGAVALAVGGIVLGYPVASVFAAVLEAKLGRKESRY